MTKINVNKTMSRMVAKVGAKVAHGDLNQACVMFIYQPKRPKAIKNSLKFKY